MGVWNESLVAMLKWNREQKTIEEEEIEKGMCPDDNYPLKINSKGEMSCLFCGRVWHYENKL